MESSKLWKSLLNMSNQYRFKFDLREIDGRAVFNHVIQNRISGYLIIGNFIYVEERKDI